MIRKRSAITSVDSDAKRSKKENSFVDDIRVDDNSVENIDSNIESYHLPIPDAPLEDVHTRGDNSSSKAAPEYIGEIDSGEGKRHVFLIPCERHVEGVLEKYTYPTLTGSQSTKFPVYVSTGVNTILCNQTVCLIPFFGVATYNMYNARNRRMELMAPLIKCDYIHDVTGYPRMDVQIVDDVKRFVTDDIPSDVVKRYLNRDDIDTNDRNVKELSRKLGSRLFVESILECRETIESMIKNLPERKINTVFELNKAIGMNNFFGIDLSTVDSTSKVFMDLGEYTDLKNTAYSLNFKINKKEDYDYHRRVLDMYRELHTSSYDRITQAPPIGAVYKNIVDIQLERQRQNGGSTRLLYLHNKQYYNMLKN